MGRISVALLFAAAVAVTPCHAQPGPRVVKLTLQPAKPPTPAMKLPLLPELRDLRIGNAAVYYHRSHSPEWEHVLTRMPDYGQFHDWLDMPLDKAPVDRLGGVTVSMLRELDIAARMESCDWQMEQRIRDEGPAMLIPDMQGFRTMIVLLALRSRSEMRDGKLDQAVYSFQTGMAMARHIGESPTLITYLIGVVCARTTLDRIEEFIQQPGAANLYWSLTDLPRPLIDLRRPLQGERIFVESIFPEIRRALRDSATVPIPAERLRGNFDKLAYLGVRSDRVASAVSAATIYPRASKFLVDQGRSAQDVAALPVAQVALMYGMAQHDQWADDFYKLHNLPYWEAAPRLKALHDRWFASEQTYRTALGPFRELFFQPGRIYLAQASVQQRIDLLRTVEAIRLHAALHEGALPASLADIREVPIPHDPITGKPFSYKKEGDRAVLEAAPLADQVLFPSHGARIEIAMMPPQKKGG